MQSGDPAQHSELRCLASMSLIFCMIDMMGNSFGGKQGDLVAAEKVCRVTDWKGAWIVLRTSLRSSDVVPLSERTWRQAGVGRGGHGPE